MVPNRFVARFQFLLWLCLLLALLSFPRFGTDSIRAQETADSQRGVIQGKVVRKDDADPIANAEVRLVPIRRGANLLQAKAIKVQTSDTGEFRFADVAPGKYRLLAFYEDLVSRSRRFQGEEVAVKDDGIVSQQPVLELWPGHRIQVNVRSAETKEPLKNARIRLAYSDSDRDHFTDENGNVEIFGLTPEAWQIETTAEGHAEETKSITLKPNQLTTEVSVMLDAGGEISGQVVDDEGKPLADVGISVFPAEGRGGQIEYLTTGPDGRYVFPYLPFMVLRFSFSKDDYLRSRDEITLTSLEREKVFDKVLQRRPYGGGILVTVQTYAGEPIPDATISNDGRSSRDHREGKTDASGQCLLENLFEGSIGHEITVRAKGFAPKQLPVKPGPKEAPADVIVKLERGHTLKGRVLLDDGEPAKGIRVYFAEGEHPGGIGGRTNTDEYGRFEFDSLPKPCTFTFYAPRGYSGIDDLELELDTDQEHLIKLEQDAAVRGRVVDAQTGEPVKAFNVKLSFCRATQAGDPKLRSMSSRLMDPGSEFSGPKGDFVIEGLLHHCPFQVTIEAPGYERHIAPRVIAIHADEEIPEFKIDRINPDDYQEIYGRLLTKRGKPIRGAQIRLLVTKGQRGDIQEARFPFNWTMIENGQVERQQQCRQFLKADTNEIGLFEFPKVKRGQELTLYYWGETTAPGRIDEVDKLAQDRDAFEITTEPAAKITVTYDPRMFPDATGISLMSRNFGYQTIDLSDGKTSYVIDGLAADNYTISLRGQRERTGASSFTVKNLVSETLELVPGEEKAVEFKEKPGRRFIIDNF